MERWSWQHDVLDDDAVHCMRLASSSEHFAPVSALKVRTGPRSRRHVRNVPEATRVT